MSPVPSVLEFRYVVFYVLLRVAPQTVSLVCLFGWGWVSTPESCKWLFNYYYFLCVINKRGSGVAILEYKGRAFGIPSLHYLWWGQLSQICSWNCFTRQSSGTWAKKAWFSGVEAPLETNNQKYSKKCPKSYAGVVQFWDTFSLFLDIFRCIFFMFFLITSRRALFPFSVPNWLPKAPFWRSFWRLFGVRVETWKRCFRIGFSTF